MGKIITGAILSLGGLALILFRMQLVYAIVGTIKTKIGILLNVDRLQFLIWAILVVGGILVLVGMVFILIGIIKRKKNAA